MKRNYTAVVILSLITAPAILCATVAGSKAGERASSDSYARSAAHTQQQQTECQARYNKCIGPRCLSEKALCDSLSLAQSAEGPEYAFKEGWPYPFISRSGDSLNHNVSIEPVELFVDWGIFFLISIVFWSAMQEVFFAIRARRVEPNAS